ncbi:MAG: hypothetical protein IT181_26250 [Acidobacteria bacterium]|nr:hypothetical protein [Acidobacteriota bacterium]
MRLARALAPLVTFGCCLAAVTAAAQPPSARLRGPVFTANIYGGYDVPLFTTSVTQPSTAGNPTLQPANQIFSGADANVNYTKAGRRVALTLQANASNRYYPQFTPSTAPSYGASVTLSSTSTSRWAWNVTQFAHYAPISGTSLFAGAGTNIANSQSVALTSASAFQVSTVRLVDVNTAAGLSYSLSRRTSVDVSGLIGGIVPIDSQITRSTRLNGRLRLNRQISRALRAYVAYGITQNRIEATSTQPAASYEITGFDFGVDFAKPFQLTRSTTLGFSTGLVRVPESQSQSYQLTGTATLDQRFRGTWGASATATRDARFVQAYRNAVVFLGGSAAVSGRLVGQLGTIMAVNYSTGDINTTVGKSAFRSYSASAQLRYDFRRRVASFVEYSAFRSEIDDSTALIGFPTGSFGRHGVRGGLSFGLSPFTR